MNNVIEFTSGNTIYSTSFVIARNIFLIILFLLVVYFLLLIFYKGRKKIITITDKWIAKSGNFVHESGDLERYIVVYMKQYGESKKEYLVHCLGYVYDELEIGKTYLVLKRFKIIKEVLEQMDL
ncbi:MAG: hypothetical protein FWG70_09675 [Oscillospiraceae bacterium]|nr:hypothetical protein [Oscillospiraceae bacterium]